MTTRSIKRRGMILSFMLMASMLMSVVMTGSLLPGAGVARAADTFCSVGTRFFASAGVGTIFEVGDTWQGGTFTYIENDNIMRVVLEDQAVTGAIAVGEFEQPRLKGDDATIEFDRQIRITSILWYDNDPKNPNEDGVAEPGWSLNGIAAELTGNRGTAVTHVDLVTDVVSISAGLDSGGVDFCYEEIGAEGCTPGYWKQDQHLDSWVGYSPNQTVGSVFTGVHASLASQTLLQALDGGGGSGILGAQSILLRAAVAALLNASSPDVAYPLGTADIIAQVNAALASGNRDTILALASDLDAKNNLGCPLS